MSQSEIGELDLGDCQPRLASAMQASLIAYCLLEVCWSVMASAEEDDGGAAKNPPQTLRLLSRVIGRAEDFGHIPSSSSNSTSPS